MIKIIAIARTLRLQKHKTTKKNFVCNVVAKDEQIVIQ